MKLACQEGLVPGRDLAEKLDNLAEYGYEGIEFGGWGIEGRVDEILRATGNHPVKPSTICAGYGGCLLDANKEERDKAIDGITRLLKVAGHIGAVGLIVVPVFGAPRLPDLSPYKGVRELQDELLVTLLKELADVAEEAGALILLEPLNRYEARYLRRVDEAVAICQKVGKPGVRVMGDFFHMNIEEADIAASIKAAGDYLQHIHLADSNRVLPGMGHTDFASGFAALKEIGYSNYMALECGVPGDRAVELKKSADFMKQWL